MKYLLDTAVLSEMRKTDPDARAAAWYYSVEEENLYISVITIGEIQKGIALIERRTQTNATALKSWLERVKQVFSKRILPINLADAIEWGFVCARTGNTHDDNLIAATAIVNGLVVATRNTRHFEGTGASFYDPWTG